MVKKNSKSIWWKVGGVWFLLIGIINLAIFFSLISNNNILSTKLAMNFPLSILFVLLIFEWVLQFLISYLYFQRNNSALTFTLLYAVTEGGLKIISGGFLDGGFGKIIGGTIFIIISLFIGYKAKQTS